MCTVPRFSWRLVKHCSQVLGDLEGIEINGQILPQGLLFLGAKNTTYLFIKWKVFMFVDDKAEGLVFRNLISAHCI